MATKTAARQPYGSGSVFRRKSDQRWIVKVQAGWNPNGTRRVIQRSLPATASKSDALRLRRDLQRDLAKDGIPEAGTGRATVKSWAATWLGMHVKDVRPNTFTTDAGAIHKWVVPTIGQRRLADLTPGDIRAVHLAITAAGRSSTTARQAHWTIMGMLKAAILEGHPVPQRVLLVEAPRKALSDRDAIPLADALAILEAARGPGAARWVAALLQGMRQGEVLGLTRQCIDLAPTKGAPHGRIDVSWQLQSLPYLDKKDRSKGFRIPDGYEARHLTHSYHLTRPKTARGQRIIPLVSWMRAALDEWLAVAPPNPWGLVWCGEDNRNGRHRVTPLRGTVDRQAWEALQTAAGVAHATGRPYALHEARHTCATFLLEGGVDPETVKAILGHSSIITSRGYQHVGQELTMAALEGVAARLRPVHQLPPA